jgi:hypothetical protein
MHEALLTRGDVQGLGTPYKNMIHVRQNCVLVHNDGCHQLAGTLISQKLCCAQIIAYEGAKEVTRWLDTLRATGKFPETILHQALSLVQQVINAGCIREL